MTHPNILNLQYVIEDEQSYAIATELMSDGDLIDYLSSFPSSFLNENRARYICKSLIDAVQYLHSKEIGHRDIKPENILFSSSYYSPAKIEAEPILKLGDFGLAKVELSPNCFKTMCGTLSYAAPEILDRNSRSSEVFIRKIMAILQAYCLFLLLVDFPKRSKLQ